MQKMAVMQIGWHSAKKKEGEACLLVTAAIISTASSWVQPHFCITGKI